MTLTLSDPKPKRAAKRPADPDTLRRLVARIEEMKDTRLDELVEDLFATEKFRMKTVDDVVMITLAGIASATTAGLHQALTNWANAARREITTAGGA